MKLRNGHAPGHFRDTFLAAVEAFTSWKHGEPEPTVQHEIRYEAHAVPISRACGLLWNCTDIMPAWELKELRGAGLDIGLNTYAACARAMLRAIQGTSQG